MVEIRPGETVLEGGDEHQQPKKRVSVKADWVFVQMGAEPPEQFLARCGVAFRKVEGSVIPTLKQSDSPLEQYTSATADGVYLIGSLIGGDQIKLAVQQGAAVIDHILGLLPPSPGEEQLMQKFAGIPGGDVEAKLHYFAACVPLLHAVPRPQLRDLALLSTVHHVGAGQTIGLEGTYATALYTIIDGCVKLRSHAAPNSTMTLRQGEFFGEEFFSDRPFAASATSVTASVLLAIPRRTILEALQRVPSLQQQIESVQTLRTLQRALCPDLDLDQVRWLATKATRISCHKDETIFTQGERADAVYVLLQGSIKLSGRNNEGIGYIMTYLEGGAYFGEIALLDTTTDMREATATVASRTCQVLRIRKDDFLTFVHAHPHLKKQMKRESSQRVLQNVVHATRATASERPVDVVGKLDLASSTDVLLIDQTKCIRCNNCVDACAATHHGQPRLNRADGPSFAQIHVPVSCRHCEGTPCLQDCPLDAIMRDADGVVQIDAKTCIGCGNCAQSCPYKVIVMVEPPQPKTSWASFTHIVDFLRPKKVEEHTEGHRQIAVKCDLCFNIAGGPACVHNCPTGAAIRVKGVDVPATVAQMAAQA